MKNKIKFVRKMKGVTQKQLSMMTGISVDVLSRYETQQRQPGFTNLWLIAMALECYIEALYDFENPTCHDS